MHRQLDEALSQTLAAHGDHPYESATLSIATPYASVIYRDA